MLVNLFVKGFAQHDGILIAVATYWLSFAFVKPEVHSINEVEPGPIEDKLAIGFVAGSEEDGGGEDPLEALHHAAVPLAILEKMKEIEQLGSGAEPYNAATLAQCQGGDPDWNQPVLTVGQAKLWMADDLEEEFTVTTGVGSLVSGGTP